MNEKNLIKRYFLWVAQGRFGLAIVAGEFWAIVGILTVLSTDSTKSIGAVLLSLVLGILFGGTMALVNWAVVKRYVSQVSDFPGATHLLYEDPQGNVQADKVFWAKQNVFSVAIPDLVGNTFGTTVHLATALPELSLVVDLAFTVNDRSDRELPHGFDPQELDRYMAKGADHQDIAQWLGIVFVKMATADPHVHTVLEEVTKDTNSFVLVWNLHTALTNLAKNWKSRPLTNITAMTVRIRVPDNGDTVRFSWVK